MNRRRFLGFLSVGCVTASDAQAADGISAKLSVVLVNKTIDLDFNPVSNGVVLSVIIHGVQTESLSALQKLQCEAFVKELISDKVVVIRTYAKVKSNGADAYLADVLLPNGTTLSRELLRKKLAVLDSKVIKTRPDLVKISKSVNRGVAVITQTTYSIEKPTDRSLHPSLTNCISSFTLKGERYATLTSESQSTLSALVSKGIESSPEGWSLNLCFRVRAGDMDSPKVVVLGRTSLSAQFWMFYDSTRKLVTYGETSKTLGEFAPRIGKWQVLTYCHGIGNDEVLVDSKSLVTLTAAKTTCDVAIVPTSITSGSAPTELDVQFIEWSANRTIAGRSSIRNLDYVPKPMYAELADAYASANDVSRVGQIGNVKGLAVLGPIGIVFSIIANTLSGKGRLEIQNSGDRIFTDACKIAHSVCRVWADRNGYKMSKLDVIMRHNTQGRMVSGDSGALASTLSMISAVSKYYVDSNVAVTGSIDLSGNVLAVGGIEDKSLAALRDRRVLMLVIPRSVVSQIRAAFLAEPASFMTHQVIAVNHIDQAISYMMLTGGQGRLVSISKRVNEARLDIVRAMTSYRKMMFGDAIRALEDAVTKCPEDIVAATWIDLINSDYTRIKRELDDF